MLEQEAHSLGGKKKGKKPQHLFLCSKNLKVQYTNVQNPIEVDFGHHVLCFMVEIHFIF